MNNNYHTSSNKQILDVQPRLGGFLWAYIILSIPGFITGIIWLIGSIVIIITLIAGISSVNTSSQPEQFTLESLQTNSRTANGILIYDLSGPIDTSTTGLTTSDRNTGIYTDLVAKDFQEIKQRSEIKNVVFRVNTPGGSVFASQVLGDQIKDLLASKNQEEAVFYFDQVVASGGLLAAYKNNNYVVASNYGETGSIGVILTLPNFKGLADKVGYSQTVIKSSQSKDIGSPLRDITPEEQKYFQNQIDAEYEKFVSIVANGRKLDKAKVKTFANGLVYANSEAKNLGLIDELGDISRAINKAKDNAGLGDDFNVWEIKTESGLFDGLLGSSNLNILGISESTNRVIDRATYLKPGTLYVIDEYKL